MRRREFNLLALGAAPLLVESGKNSFSLFGDPTTSTLASATAPPEGGDARRVGVRPNGAYWGANPEQIDVLSGNLSYSLPLIQAKSRGLSLAIVWSYNSQLWRADSTGLRSFGVDTGYGFGWRAQTGSIVPTQAGKKGAAGYTYIDRTGAEYSMVADGSVWETVNGLHLTFDPKQAVLYFPDGTCWSMGCVSAASEADAGAMYPTVVEDSNGNQIFIRYLAGIGQKAPNTSSRISEIEDARAQGTAPARRTFAFLYSADALPRLLSVASQIGNTQSYSFTYTKVSVTSPIGAMPGTTSGTTPGTTSGTTSGAIIVTLLTGLSDATGAGYTFSWSGQGTGELAGVTIPHGGQTGWAYQTVTRSDGTSTREVAGRSIQASASDTPDQYLLSHPAGDNQGTAHSQTAITQTDATWVKTWKFNTAPGSPDLGLCTECDDSSQNGALLQQEEYGWASGVNGNIHRVSVSTTLDPATKNAATTQENREFDAYGNVTSIQRQDFNSANQPTVRTTNTYLTDSPYVSRYIRNRLVSTTVSDSNGSFQTVNNIYDSTALTVRTGLSEHDSANYTSSVTFRGNVTESTVQGIYKRITYDITGMVASVLDSAGTQISVAPAAGTNNAAVGLVLPNGNPALGTQTQFDSLGRPTAIVRPNGAQTTIGWDASGRPASVTSPDGAATSLNYGLNPTTITKSVNGRFSKRTLDGLGRTAKREVGDGSGTQALRQFEYQSAANAPKGRLKRASLTQSPTGSPVWLNYQRDDLGRISSHDIPQGAGSQSYAYSGNAVTVTDPAGRTKSIVRRYSGRPAAVSQPNPGGPDTSVQYSSNALGSRTSVAQSGPDGSQSRSFAYDANGKLATRKHAESGPRTLSRNVDGSVSARVDAIGQRVQYSRDNLKRIVSETRYDAGGKVQTPQGVAYSYDANPYNSAYSQNASGRLAAMQWGTTASLPGLVTEMYSYSTSGRVTGKRVQVTRGASTVALDLSYVYDSEGRVTSISYTGGQTLNYSYDSMGRPVALNAGSTPVVSNVAWTPANQIAGIRQLATDAGEYLTETRTFDSRNRLSRITAAPVDANQSHYVPSVDLEYAYSSTDGKVASETDHVAGDSVAYAYDQQARLTGAQTSSAKWGLQLAYDTFGNRTSQQITSGSGPSHSTKHDPATNHIVSDPTIGYDANGNITSLPQLALSYDIQNRLSQAVHQTNGTEQYGYDPSNQRIWMRTTTANGSSEEWYLYGVDGKQLASYALAVDSHGNLSLTLEDSNIYFGPRMVQSRNESVVQDRLGAVRGWAGSEHGARTTRYLPYGEEELPTGDDTAKFGAYTRDSVTGLDYAKNRYYSSALGRFITPDPYEGSARAATPGSWNRCGFVLDDPANRVDPSGLDDSYGSVVGSAGYVPYDPSPVDSPLYFAPSGGGGADIPVYAGPGSAGPSYLSVSDEDVNVDGEEPGLDPALVDAVASLLSAPSITEVVSCGAATAGIAAIPAAMGTDAAIYAAGAYVLGTGSSLYSCYGQ